MNISEAAKTDRPSLSDHVVTSNTSTISARSATEIAIRRQTPARVFVGRSGPAYRTATQLELRSDHAAARDAVQASFDLVSDFEPGFVDRWALFTVTTAAATKQEFLLRPDLGRLLPEPSRGALLKRCSVGVDFQVAIGDGLSALAVVRQIPTLLPALAELVGKRNWTWGQPFVIERCRVGVLNEIGDCLRPKVAVLLIGERPGLATAESLSAYMAFRPQAGHTDANRNLISNIHVRGIPTDQAAERIVALAAAMIRDNTSGVAIKEDWTQRLAGH